MINLSAILLKAKAILYFSTRKKADLERHDKRIAGKILRIMYNVQSPMFEIANFVKISKKQRSNIEEVRIKDIFQYNFIGLCIAHRKDQFLINTSMLVRNVFNGVAYESFLALYTPSIDSASVNPDIDKLSCSNHGKYYYLRHKPLPQSTIFFSYVVDMYPHDTKKEEPIGIFLNYNNESYTTYHLRNDRP